MEFPEERPVGVISPCIPRNSSTNCTTILYHPNGIAVLQYETNAFVVPWVESLMKEVAIRSSLDFEKDFALWREEKGAIYMTDLSL